MGRSNWTQCCQRLATAATFSLKGAVFPVRNDAEMGPAKSLHASAYYSKYNQRFNLFDLRIRQLGWVVLSVPAKTSIRPSSAPRIFKEGRRKF